MQEKDNILRIFKEAKEAIIKEDGIALNKLSNQTINTASLTQDPENIAVAVLVYSLSKVVEEKKYQNFVGWKKSLKEIITCIDQAISAIKRQDNNLLTKSLKNIRAKISNLSNKLKSYIKEVFRQASTNKASRIYEHGISMERTASLLGITMFELAGYAGQTNIPESKLCRTCDIKDRIKVAVEMFS